MVRLWLVFIPQRFLFPCNSLAFWSQMTELKPSFNHYLGFNTFQNCKPFILLPSTWNSWRGKQNVGNRFIIITFFRVFFFQKSSNQFFLSPWWKLKFLIGHLVLSSFSYKWRVIFLATVAVISFTISITIFTGEVV